MIKILFVCMGNICRSPSGEAVMNGLIKEKNLEDKIQCESAGTLGYHTGEKADARMRKHASKRGYDLTSIARQVQVEDFKEFDYILAMDQANYNDISALDYNGALKDRLFKMTDFCSNHNYDEVPDPYYGGAEGFELVLDLLEDACIGFIYRLKLEKKL